MDAPRGQPAASHRLRPVGLRPRVGDGGVIFPRHSAARSPCCSLLPLPPVRRTPGGRTAAMMNSSIRCRIAVATSRWAAGASAPTSSRVPIRIFSTSPHAISTARYRPRTMPARLPVRSPATRDRLPFAASSLCRGAATRCRCRQRCCSDRRRDTPTGGCWASRLALPPALRRMTGRSPALCKDGQARRMGACAGVV